MERHTSSEAVALPGCIAIDNLCYFGLLFNSPIKNKLKAAGVHSVLNSVTRDHGGNQLIVKYAQKVLAVIPI
eukprot:7091-Heterococcus_DN1.PRE.1